ncbi:hypothetical protein GUITHDRAFT_109016 [Guillardia theta CCMP2712]|uniref:Uncharacterized protein n=1 Tax=Guillardia theta (strain CCMP2712) TaxID=905079 RepID=L1J8U7_GUITC|nr:hypothetical protein GUITHDRAFT_109016 [Guillardia theta CCMP2712]EKX44973.1 hypothetical protein GUITHDRAFT_109016 [Guillardia theta CCMP2712]|eukprot:XP_005831953.1 hypothetical protein GUITHDRAFT_109016 [Guillardia theta CCMP2712]
MGKRASRYSVRSKKIRQESKSLEKLFEEAHEVSAAFQLWSQRREGGDGLYLNITSIKNRYDRRYDLRACGGYRDLCICVEVGWTVNAKNGSCTFIPLKQWDETLNLRRHICEVQVLLEEMYTVKQHVHKEYVNFRNVLCQ